jgi:uncharacterized protein YdaU (DUF1376 family)
MSVTINGETFVSPEYKLLEFFHRSRDQWEAKAKERNVRVKRLTNKVAAMHASRKQWKQKARAYEARIAALEKELEEQKIAAG